MWDVSENSVCHSLDRQICNHPPLCVLANKQDSKEATINQLERVFSLLVATGWDASGIVCLAHAKIAGMCSTKCKELARFSLLINTSRTAAALGYWCVHPHCRRTVNSIRPTESYIGTCVSSHFLYTTL